MSSSSRFLIGLAGTMLAGFALLAAAAFLTDPRGLVAAAFPGAPRLCAPGADQDLRALNPYLIVPRQPREILVGTSRAAHGFAAADAQMMLRQLALNLSIGSASLEEAAQLIRHGWAASPVERVWLGLEWGMFREPSGRRLRIPPIMDRRLFALRYGVLDPAAFRRPLAYLAGDPGCRRPRSDFLGFPIEAASLEQSTIGEAQFGEIEALFRRHFQRRARMPAAERRAGARTQLRLLRELIRESRARGSQFVLYIAPVHPSLLDVMAQTGLRTEYDQWRRDVAALAAAEGSPTLNFFDVSEDPGVAAAAHRPACAKGGPPPCPFRDQVHFRHGVGRMILATGTRLAPPLR